MMKIKKHFQIKKINLPKPSSKEVCFLHLYTSVGPQAPRQNVSPWKPPAVTALRPRPSPLRQQKTSLSQSLWTARIQQWDKTPTSASCCKIAAPSGERSTCTARRPSCTTPACTRPQWGGTAPTWRSCPVRVRGEQKKKVHFCCCSFFSFAVVISWTGCRTERCRWQWLMFKMQRAGVPYLEIDSQVFRRICSWP